MTAMALPTSEAIRSLFAFEDVLKQLPGAEFPVEHFHIPGVYARKIFMPSGSVITSRVHKADNISVVASGSCVVVQNGERWHLQAGDVWVTRAGTKRALYMPEDCVWVTIHGNPNDLTDPAEIFDFYTTNDCEEALRLIHEG
jgi:quercetin dioxygenase-like cupin family protein